MTGWVIFVGAAPLVGWIASRHGRNPVGWALMALLASGVVSALVIQLSVALLAHSELVALATVVLSPLLGLAATIAVGVFAARTVGVVVDRAPASAIAPDETLVMVRLPNEATGSAAGAPYCAESRCRLVLGERMLTLVGTPPARTSLAYRFVAASAADPDVLRLSWTNRDGDNVMVLLRPADVDTEQRAEIVASVVRRVAAQHEDPPRA
jgi:hypothetical protein